MAVMVALDETVSVVVRGVRELVGREVAVPVAVPVLDPLVVAGRRVVVVV